MKTSSLGADNICFILKVAKENPSWANIVPAQDFTVRLALASDGGNESSPDKPAPLASQISKHHFAQGLTSTPTPTHPCLGPDWTFLTAYSLTLPPGPPISHPYSRKAY